MQKKKLFHFFVDLEKAFDKVPRQAIEWALRRQLVPEWLLRAVMGLYHHGGKCELKGRNPRPLLYNFKSSLSVR